MELLRLLIVAFMPNFTYKTSINFNTSSLVKLSVPYRYNRGNFVRPLVIKKHGYNFYTLSLSFKSKILANPSSVKCFLASTIESISDQIL
jgi:hypothetical protein